MLIRSSTNSINFLPHHKDWSVVSNLPILSLAVYFTTNLRFFQLFEFFYCNQIPQQILTLYRFQQKQLIQNKKSQEKEEEKSKIKARKTIERVNMFQMIRQDEDARSTVSLQTQAEDNETLFGSDENSKEIEGLLRQRANLKILMKNECKSDCCGKEEYISFDNHINLLEISYYKQFIWPICKQGLALNLQMHETCKKLWKLRYRDYQNYLEATYIFI